MIPALREYILAICETVVFRSAVSRWLMQITLTQTSEVGKSQFGNP